MSNNLEKYNLPNIQLVDKIPESTSENNLKNQNKNFDNVENNINKKNINNINQNSNDNMYLSKENIINNSIENEYTKTNNFSLIDKFLDDIGMTWYHYRIYIILSLFFLADGAEMIVISLLIKQIGKLWNLTDAEMGFAGSAVFVGFFLGAIVAGKISDLRGRKPVFIIGAILVCIFSTVSAFATNFINFIILRAINGFGIGISIPSSSSLAAEITPTKYRSWVLNLVWIFFPFGEIFATLIAREFLPHENGWRKLLGFAAVPTFISAILSFFIYESPRFYLSIKNYDRAFLGLERILFYRKKILIKKKTFNQEIEFENNNNIEKNYDNTIDKNNKKEELNIFLTIDNKLTEEAKKIIIEENEKMQEIKPEFSSLFKKNNLRITVLCCFIFYVCSFVYYGLIFILPQTIIYIEPGNNNLYNSIIGNDTIIHNNSFSNKTAADNEDEMYKGIILSALSEIPSTFLAGYIGNLPFLGRKGSMFYGLLLSGISSILCAMNMRNLSVFATALKFFIDIPLGIIYLYVSEAYPTIIRTIAIGFTNSFNRLGGITTPLISQLVFSIERNNPYKIYAVLSFLAAIATYLLPFETLGRNIS